MRRKLLLTLLALGFLVVPGDEVKADVVYDYYSTTYSSTTPIDAVGHVSDSFSSFFVDFWTPSNVRHRCDNGSSWNPAYTLDERMNTCASTFAALGSTTIRAVVGDSTKFAVFMGIWGGNVWRVSPEDGASGTTHVVSIESPTLYGTTTSPVLVEFTYEQGTPTAANGFQLEFRNTLTGEYKSTLEYFSGGGSEGIFQASTSVSVPWQGTTGLTISLIEGAPDVPSVSPSIIDTYPAHWFGIDYNDNSQTVVFGPAYLSYSSTTCQISFAGTFNFSDCLGYLMTPSPALYEAYGSLPGNLGTRFPFVYVAQLPAIKDSLLASPQTASTTVSVEIPWFNETTTELTFLSEEMIENVPFATTIKTLLGWILWILLANAIYFRVLGVHDKETKV